MEHVGSESTFPCFFLSLERNALLLLKLYRMIFNPHLLLSYSCIHDVSCCSMFDTSPHVSFCCLLSCRATSREEKAAVEEQLAQEQGQVKALAEGKR